MANDILSGKWTYRSFHNNPAPVGDNAEAALALIFAEAEFTFQLGSGNDLQGLIDWGNGGLDLTGAIRPASAGVPLGVAIVGLGRPGSQTDGWNLTTTPTSPSNGRTASNRFLLWSAL